MSVRKERKFKLGFPLKFERKESKLLVIGNFENDHSIDLEELDSFNIKSIDADGFALFEVKYSTKPRKSILQVRPQAEAGINGYTLFHSSVTKSTSYGHMKSNYEYYKRNHDLSYYVLIKREGIQPTKIVLGSMFDPESRMNQFVQIISRNFGMEQWFDRKTLATFLPKPLQYGRIMKCILDILTKEKFLVESEAPPSGRKGRKREIFQKTRTLVEFIMRLRSIQKPNGVNVGQLPLTSDR